jgi:hypothetical protein
LTASLLDDDDDGGGDGGVGDDALSVAFSSENPANDDDDDDDDDEGDEGTYAFESNVFEFFEIVRECEYVARDAARLRLNTPPTFADTPLARR